MARLIDADNIISVCEILSEKGNDPHYWGQLISIIEDAPTIDAIPVEWLEEHDSEGNEYGRRYITVVEALSMWEKEQGGEIVRLEPANIVCPKCGNGNYMRYLIGKGVGRLNMKCINCNSYFNSDELHKQAGGRDSG